MIVQAGRVLSNHQTNGILPRQVEEDKKTFEDALLGAQKKKEFKSSPENKEPLKKQTSNNELIGEPPKEIRRESQPVKSEQQDQVVQTPVKPVVNTGKNEGPFENDVQSLNDLTSQVVVAGKNEIPFESEVESSVLTNKKFIEAQEIKSQVADSINLSGIEKETLENNLQKIKSTEIPFQEMIEQMDDQNIEANTLVKGEPALGQAMVNQKSISGGTIKIDPQMKMADVGETFEPGLNFDQTVKSGIESRSGESGSEDQPMNLESMINQAMEQEGAPKDVEGSAFAEELKLGQDSSQSERIENMQSIIKQARTIVDDGGGSMEIHLQPEGLGKVHLKVAVNDGQVNVEMLADNASAKKALEDNLMEIKHALEGQKLLVETLKVEMSPDYQKDFTDMQQHLQDQANRDFAEQFLDQFQRERQEKFGGLFDSFRSFQPGEKESELRLARRNPYTENGKGRTVNLVA